MLEFSRSMSLGGWTWRLFRASRYFRKVMDSNQNTIRKDQSAFDLVLQLADIAGPRTLGEFGQSRGANAGNWTGMSIGKILKELVHQQRNVIEPFAERRQIDYDW